ncbi:HEAT repeat domain-containing protein [Sphaerisporangium perillae]|uniref:HEAT repeat domain-containing protein n=1 Tax=Sphaerisporangium perillae TaxID=2935860 RepID=UPI00200D95C3|nr:HEAT repeat domain-containing protein [Sphaerisporangium perillae]
MVSIGGSSDGRSDGHPGTGTHAAPGEARAATEVPVVAEGRPQSWIRSLRWVRADAGVAGELAKRSVGELIAMALGDDDPDGPARWNAVDALHARGDLETFTEARRLCASDSGVERVLGVDILGELGTPHRPFLDKSLSVLRYLAAADDDVRVLHAVLIAFGHLRDQRALPSVIQLSTHPDPTVRYGAAYALSHVLGRPADPAGLAALRRLARDEDEDVADWAALGLILP